MSAPRKYHEEVRERAVRMYRDRLEQVGESKVEARRRVGALLDVNPATLRNWVEDAERAEGARAPAARLGADPEEVRALKRRVAELERANETSHACGVSSGAECGGVRARGEGDVFAVGRAGLEAVEEHAEEAVEQVALGRGVSVAGGSAAVVVGAGAR